MSKSEMLTCQSCGCFSKSQEEECPFCGTSLVLRRKSFTKLAVSFVATASIVAAGSLVSCSAAYGLPPSGSNCGPGKVLDQTGQNCVPKTEQGSENASVEQTSTEQVAADGGASE